MWHRRLLAPAAEPSTEQRPFPLRAICERPLSFAPDARSGRWLLHKPPGGLTGAFLRVGSKKSEVVARPRHALPGLGAPSPPQRPSQRAPPRSWQTALSTTTSERVVRREPDACFRGTKQS